MKSKFNNVISFITMTILFLLVIIDGMLSYIPIPFLYLSLIWFITSFLWMCYNAIKTHHIKWEYDTILLSVVGVVSIIKVITLLKK